MAARRRPPGSAVGSPVLYARVAAEAKAVSENAALRLGVSEAEFVEALLLHVGASLTEDGIPPWWPKPVAVQEGLSEAS